MLPGLHERVGDLGDVDGEAADVLDDLEEGVEGAEAVGELHDLSPQHIVAGLHLEEGLLLGTDALRNLAVGYLQPARLRRQILHLLLLPHPRPPRRFAVR